MNPDQAESIIARCQSDPVFCIQEFFGVKTLTWDMHQEILRSFITDDRVTVKSGHSLGKDFISGVLALWFLYSFKPSVVITTGPTSRQVDHVIWGEISKYWRTSRYPLGGRLLNHELHPDPNRDDWYAIGFTAKETGDSVGKFQGLKGKNVMVIVTEAQAVDDIIHEQIEGVLTSSNSKLYLAGNPLHTEGAFYRSFSDPTFKKFSLSCYDSPNYKAGREVIPGMVGRKWVTDKEQRWGIDSPLFQARVLGEFPKQSVFSLVSISDLEKALHAEPVAGYKVLAVDPARFGDDSTALASVNGGKLEWIEEYQGLATPRVEGIIMNHLVEKGDYDYLVVDEGAMGAGIFDHLQEQVVKVNQDRRREGKRMLNVDVMPFNFGGKPFDDKFANLSADAYFWVCDLIKQGKVQLVENADLFNQLASRKYEFNEAGKMRLESKEKIKKRGLPSPDAADAFVMAIWQSVSEDFKSKQELIEEDEAMEVERFDTYEGTGYPKREQEVFV